MSTRAEGFPGAAPAAHAVTEPESEAALIARCLAGDGESFRPLVKAHERQAFVVALRMLGRRADAEDVVQQAFVDAYAALDQFDGGGRERAFAAWFLRIVINRCKDVLKSKKRTETSLDAVEVAGEAAVFSHVPRGPEKAHAESERRHLLARALVAVPAKYREVLILKDVEDLPYEEIRSVLRLPITTLKIRVVRARAMLRERFERLERSA